MKSIKITRGTFGLPVGRSVIPKTPADPPFEVDDALAARLVAKQVAEYVDAKAATGVAPPGSPPPDTGNGPRAYDDTMKLDLLKDIAKTDYGVSAEKVDGLRAKAAVVAAIDAHRAAGQSEQAQNRAPAAEEQKQGGADDQVKDDNDPPPVITAQDPV